MEPALYDSSVSSTAASNGFSLRGLDALPNRTTGVRAGSSFFNGFSPATTPSQLSSANRRQIAILNGVRNSPGKQFLQILVNDHPDGALTTTEGTAMRAAINSVMPGNAPPMISDVMNVSVLRDMMTAPLPVTVSDAETAAAALAVSAVASDATLVPPSSIVLGGSGMNRTIKVTPAPGRTGSTTITLSVSDGTHIVQDSFLLAVTDPYESWAAAQGLTAANSAALFDADGDGSVNLMEYFAGTAPLQRTDPPALVREGGQTYFLCRRSKSAAVPWTLEYAATPGTLTTWTPPPADIVLTTVGDIEHLRIRLPSATRGFVRLRVTR